MSHQSQGSKLAAALGGWFKDKTAGAPNRASELQEDLRPVRLSKLRTLPAAPALAAPPVAPRQTPIAVAAEASFAAPRAGERTAASAPQAPAPRATIPAPASPVAPAPIAASPPVSQTVAAPPVMPAAARAPISPMVDSTSSTLAPIAVGASSAVATAGTVATGGTAATAGPAPAFELPVPAGKPVKAPAGAGMDQSAILVLRKTRPQLFERMIAAYLKYSPDAMAKMNEAATSGDMAALKMSSHSLKSSSANVGAMTLAGLCRQIEDLTKKGDVGPAVPLVAEASAEFALVAAFLEEQARTPLAPATA